MVPPVVVAEPVPELDSTLTTTAGCVMPVSEPPKVITNTPGPLGATVTEPGDGKPPMVGSALSAASMAAASTAVSVNASVVVVAPLKLRLYSKRGGVPVLGGAPVSMKLVVVPLLMFATRAGLEYGAGAVER